MSRRRRRARRQQYEFVDRLTVQEARRLGQTPPDPRPAPLAGGDSTSARVGRPTAPASAAHGRSGAPTPLAPVGDCSPDGRGEGRDTPGGTE